MTTILLALDVTNTTDHTGPSPTTNHTADRMSAATLHEITAGVYTARTDQGFYGLEVGARMTVLSLDAGVFVHSPIEVDPSIVEEIGQPRWVLAPNLFHHLHVRRWIDAGFEGWAAPGLPDKRADVAFHGVVESSSQPFGPEVHVLALRCFPMSNEVVVLHRPSRTLILTDLVFNLGHHTPWSTKAAMWCLGGYPGCRTTALERLRMHRPTARRELAEILSWDFDRLVMSHGEVIETGGKAALREAFGWLAVDSGLVGSAVCTSRRWR